jgi:hypothetical protein
VDNYEKLVNYIESSGLTAVELLNALVDWNGIDIISDEFIDNQRNCEGWYI